MTRVESASRTSGEYGELSTFDLRVLDVMHASRAAQEERAKFHARNAIAVYDREETSTTYESIACAEAEALGKRMLRLDRQRLLPKRRPIRLIRERDWEEFAHNGQKTHEITTPILFSHDPVHVVDTDVSDFSVDLSAGWKFTTISRGNDLRHAVACVTTPNPGDFSPRRAIRLIADYVVHDPNMGTEAVIESNVYNLYNSSVRTSPVDNISDPENERFVIQTGILRAARLACGEEIPDASVIEARVSEARI